MTGISSKFRLLTPVSFICLSVGPSAGAQTHPVLETAARAAHRALTGPLKSRLSAIRIGTLNDPDFRSLLPAETRKIIAGKPDSFALVEKEHGKAFVIGSDPRGSLYGTFHLIEEAWLSKRKVEVFSAPAFPFRAVWSWTQPSFKKDSMFPIPVLAEGRIPESVRDFADTLARMGANCFILWSKLGSAAPKATAREKLRRKALATLFGFLKKEYGVECYLFLIYARKKEDSELCVHDPKVKERWRSLVIDLFTTLPGLRGLIMAGAGGDWVPAPWECTCPWCRALTHRELLLKAMRMIAEPMRPFSGRLIWKAVTDRPTRVKSEIEHFARLEGKLPRGVSVSFKTFYKDFRPPHPENAMFHHLAPAPRQGFLAYVLELQIFGKYRGHDRFPCCMAERWAPLFRRAYKNRLEGAIGIIAPRAREGFDHPLNRVNWYVWGRLCWEPEAAPGELMRRWAVLNYGKKAADTVVEVLRETYRAAVKIFFGLGIMTQFHSDLPSINYELESSFCGPWHDIPRAPEGFIGRAHDLSMYPKEVRRRIEADPKLLLFAHRVPLETRLARILLKEKDDALRSIERMNALWETLKGSVPEKRFEPVAEMLGENLWDAKIWRENFALYLDYKLGRLTLQDLSERLRKLEALKGKGLLVREAAFERVLGEWEDVLEGRFKRRVMEGRWWAPPESWWPPGLAGVALPLKNPGLDEPGGPDGANPTVAAGWQNTDGKPHPGWYGIDRKVKRSGAGSQRMSYIPGLSDPWGTIWQFTPAGSAKPGHLYEASVWCRTQGIKGPSKKWGGLRLAVRFFDKKGRCLSEARAPLDWNEDHNWRPVGVRSAAPEGAWRIQIVLFLHTEAGTIWYDDVQVKDLGPQP